MADQTTLDVLVRAQADQKSITDVEKDFKSLQRRLKDMGVDWGKVSKQASAFTTELRTISDAAGTFVKKLGTATTDSLKHLGKLADDLEDAQDKAEELTNAYKDAATNAREGIAKDIAEQAKAIAGITQMVNAERVARGKEIQQITKLVKAQERYQKKIQQAAKFDMGDMWSGVKDKISSGNFKGIFSEFGGGLKKSLE
jgi:predicted  nucleic acid-binding Zn-ribbon protein